MENRITEQASAYDNLQRMSVHDILTGINREDARGAGTSGRLGVTDA